MQCAGILKFLEGEPRKLDGSIHPTINWNDEQAIQYQIAINCLHNHVLGKMRVESTVNDESHVARRKKCLKFADEVDIKMNIEETNTKTGHDGIAAQFESTERECRECVEPCDRTADSAQPPANRTENGDEIMLNSPLDMSHIKPTRLSCRDSQR